jgi:signal transduction histidine kinase
MLSPGRDLAAYRVIQEALTNVLKHAGTARTMITLDYRPDGLMLEVTDDGPRTAREAAPHPQEPGRPTAPPGTGRGLIGLQERVILHAGEFDAGRRPGGGWRVVARFPAEELSVGAVTGAASLPHPAPS